MVESVHNFVALKCLPKGDESGPPRTTYKQSFFHREACSPPLVSSQTISKEKCSSLPHTPPCTHPRAPPHAHVLWAERPPHAKQARAEGPGNEAPSMPLQPAGQYMNINRDGKCGARAEGPGNEAPSMLLQVNA